MDTKNTKGRRQPASRAAQPIIDERIEYAGPSRLRGLSGSGLRDLDHVIVFQEMGNRLAVLLPYQQYMDIQARALSEAAAVGQDG